jgi:hypothetical protein
LYPKHGLSYIHGLDLNCFSLSWRLFSWKPSFKIIARCRKLYYRPIKFVLELLVILFSFENLRFFSWFSVLCRPPEDSLWPRTVSGANKNSHNLRRWRIRTREFRTTVWCVLPMSHHTSLSKKN